MDDKNFDVKQLCDILPAEVYKYFDVSPQGLSMEDALIREKRYGKNKISRASAMNPLKQLIKQFTHVMALLLWVAGILALVAGMPQLAVATWSVIIINALFSFQNQRPQQSRRRQCKIIVGIRADRVETDFSNMLSSRAETANKNEMQRTKGVPYANKSQNTKRLQIAQS